MTHYFIELALWILLAYVIGCLIGYLLRRWLGSETVETVVAQPVAAEMAPEPEPEPVIAAPVILEEPQGLAQPVMSGRMERPRGLAEARDGKPDDLQRISGIGPKNEKILHSLGFFHFDQISAWTAEQIAWVDDHLRFNGRIGREKWVQQASLLASGAEDEFKAQYGSGGIKNAAVETVAGSKNRGP